MKIAVITKNGNEWSVEGISFPTVNDAIAYCNQNNMYAKIELYK